MHDPMKPPNLIPELPTELTNLHDPLLRAVKEWTIQTAVAVWMNNVTDDERAEWQRANPINDDMMRLSHALADACRVVYPWDDFDVVYFDNGNFSGHIKEFL